MCPAACYFLGTVYKQSIMQVKDWFILFIATIKREEDSTKKKVCLDNGHVGFGGIEINGREIKSVFSIWYSETHQTHVLVFLYIYPGVVTIEQLTED